MAEEDENKLQSTPTETKAEAQNSDAQTLDRLTVLQEAPDSDLSAKKYAADENLPIDDNPATATHAKQGAQNTKDAPSGISSIGAVFLSSMQNIGKTVISFVTGNSQVSENSLEDVAENAGVSTARKQNEAAATQKDATLTANDTATNNNAPDSNLTTLDGPAPETPPPPPSPDDDDDDEDGSDVESPDTDNDDSNADDDDDDEDGSDGENPGQGNGGPNDGPAPETPLPPPSPDDGNDNDVEDPDTDNDDGDIDDNDGDDDDADVESPDTDNGDSNADDDDDDEDGNDVEDPDTNNDDSNVDDDDGNDDGNDDGDNNNRGDRGHGNDDDGVDEENPGQGSGGPNGNSGNGTTDNDNPGNNPRNNNDDAMQLGENDGVGESWENSVEDREDNGRGNDTAQDSWVSQTDQSNVDRSGGHSESKDNGKKDDPVDVLNDSAEPPQDSHQENGFDAGDKHGHRH